MSTRVTTVGQALPRLSLSPASLPGDPGHLSPGALERVFDKLGGVGEDQWLLLSPSNSVGAPAGKDRKWGSAARIQVLARLVWPTRVEIVPAVLIWISTDQVCVEWRTDPRSYQARQTWLPREDVRTRLVYRSGAGH